MRGVFDPEDLQQKLDKFELASQDENLWKDKNNAQKLLKEKSSISEKLIRFNELKNQLFQQDQLHQLSTLEEDSSLFEDIFNQLILLKKNTS